MEDFFWEVTVSHNLLKGSAFIRGTQYGDVKKIDEKELVVTVFSQENLSGIIDERAFHVTSMVRVRREKRQ